MTSAAAAPDRSIQPWRILCGLVISGFFLALPGGLLPLWGYHIHPDFGTAANYFLILGAGLGCGAWLALRLRGRIGESGLFMSGCFGGGALTLLLLAFAAPPAAFWFQGLALFSAGASSGIVNTAVFESISEAYEAKPARITLTGGIFFGIGSMLAAWLMSICLDASNPTRLLAAMALLPAAAGVVLSRHKFPAPHPALPPIASTVQDLRSPLAIMFALLLFFQFASEWSIAGWLPVILIDRLGLSPEAAVLLLLLYWFALTGGRIVATRLLSVVHHGRMVAISAFCALFGCTALLAAGTRFGIVTGILFTGAGFSAIYPLAAERISGRFSYYHPGYFNGIFTFAMMGGILAPFMLGHAAAVYGLQVIPLAALVGSCAVFALILLIWLGRKVSGS
ncbi:MAG: MFS transporter [Terriglobia bacterium]